MKTPSELRTSFRKKYKDYVDNMNELNELLPKIALQVDELLSFMETAIKIKGELEVPKPE
jgi:hypothetical protein